MENLKRILLNEISDRELYTILPCPVKMKPIQASHVQLLKSTKSLCNTASLAQIETHPGICRASHIMLYMPPKQDDFWILETQWKYFGVTCFSLYYLKIVTVSNLWSPSVVAWICAAYCKFQRTSSKDGRFDELRDMHLLVMETTTDKDSCEQDASTFGSTIFPCPSWLSRDTCKRCTTQFSDIQW